MQRTCTAEDSVKKFICVKKFIFSTFGGLSRLFKSFEFGNGSRMSDKNLVILEFKYLPNKKW